MSTRHEPDAQTWEGVPADPHPARDLGFEAVDLEVVHSSDGERSHVLVLPSEDDDLLREEAFIVADESAVVDLETRV
jgi:hypothetical protein